VTHPDAVVIGSGPNGLAAAITLARAGRSVMVFEAEKTIGGGVRSAQLTRPGFLHDVCSTVYPLAAASPLFRSLGLERYGLEWIHPPAALAHPLEDGTAVLLYPNIEATAAQLGADASAYRALMQTLSRLWPRIAESVLGPLAWPVEPAAFARFALLALQPASWTARIRFRGPRARALFAGLAAHSMMPLERPLTAGVGLLLGLLAHLVGWPLVRGGAQQLAEALARCLAAHGGRIVTGVRVRSLEELPRCRAVLCDLAPRPFLEVAGHRLPEPYRRSLDRYRYGMGAYKVDWALAEPIPWKAANCRLAATVHLGGSLEEIARSERLAFAGFHPGRPFIILVQPSLFDPSRAPEGRHTAWAYCHVPHASPYDSFEQIEAEVERFAPGFRKLILARHLTAPADFERHNPNYVGGDIGAGRMDLRQFLFRPTWRSYATPLRGLYLCSAATPPGPGVHGMCGYFAAQRALKEVLSD